MTDNRHKQDRAHSTYIPLVYLAIGSFAIIGAIDVLQAVAGRMPPSIEAAHTAFINWITTPMLSPLGFVGAVLLGMGFVVVLVYPMVGPRP